MLGFLRKKFKKFSATDFLIYKKFENRKFSGYAFEYYQKNGNANSKFKDNDKKIPSHLPFIYTIYAPPMNKLNDMARYQKQRKVNRSMMLFKKLLVEKTDQFVKRTLQLEDN